MHEYDLLERRWKKYRRKRVLLFSLPIVVVAFFVTYFYFGSTAKQPSKNIQSKKSKPQTKYTQQKSAQNSFHDMNDTKKSMQSISLYTPSSYSGSQTPETNGSIEQNPLFTPDKSFEEHLSMISSLSIAKKHEPKQKRRSVEKSVKRTVLPKAIQKPKKILIQQKMASIEDLTKEFYYAPSCSKALIIARKYYENHQYKDSMKWSLKANELDKKNEESWILFAKSLYKTGQKQKAIQTLQFYLRKHDSPNAKAVLISMQKGIFND